MWLTVREFEDIRYETTDEGKIAKITINRPEVRNAFRPQTVKEMLVAFDLAHEDPKIGAIILTGAGDLAFCSGGDQKVRGHAGYIGEDGVPRLNVLDLQKKIRSLPKPVVAMVAGYAIGGGHVLHIVCDLTIAADNARFGQTGPKVGSFDGGLGLAAPAFYPKFFLTAHVEISRNRAGVFRGMLVSLRGLPRSCSRGGWRYPRGRAGPSGRRNPR